MLPETTYEIMTNETLRNQVYAGVFKEYPDEGLDWDRAFAAKSDIDDARVIWDANVEQLDEVKLLHLTGNATFTNKDDQPRTIYGIFFYINDNDEPRLLQSEVFLSLTIDNINDTITLPIELWIFGRGNATS